MLERVRNGACAPPRGEAWRAVTKTRPTPTGIILTLDLSYRCGDMYHVQNDTTRAGLVVLIEVQRRRQVRLHVGLVAEGLQDSGRLLVFDVHLLRALREHLLARLLGLLAARASPDEVQRRLAHATSAVAQRKRNDTTDYPAHMNMPTRPPPGDEEFPGEVGPTGCRGGSSP